MNLSLIFHWGVLENFGTANYILCIALQEFLLCSQKVNGRNGDEPKDIKLST